MKHPAPHNGSLPRRVRLGNLLLVVGALILLMPLGVVAFDELSYRFQMAQVPPPSPVILSAIEGLAIQSPPTPDPKPRPADPAPPQPSSPSQDNQVYHIEISRIGVNYMVGEGVDNPILAKGPGHYSQTVAPGEEGNAALAGHRTVRGRPAFFYRLHELETGDEIRIRYRDRSLTFQVERVFLTTPYDLSVLEPTPHPSLTLTTCDPPGSDEKRLIVQSRLLRVDANL